MADDSTLRMRYANKYISELKELVEKDADKKDVLECISKLKAAMSGDPYTLIYLLDKQNNELLQEKKDLSVKITQMNEETQSFEKRKARRPSIVRIQERLPIISSVSVSSEPSS